MRRPRLEARRGALSGALLAAACGGEIERATLDERPRADDYAAHIQPTLERLGCSQGNFCHSEPRGDFKFVVSPDAAALQENYLGAKALVDLERPGESRLLRALSASSLVPGGTHAVACFRRENACGFRMLSAWIAWREEGDPRPGDLGCSVVMPAPEACDLPMSDDVCCPRALVDAPPVSDAAAADASQAPEDVGP